MDEDLKVIEMEIAARKREQEAQIVVADTKRTPAESGVDVVKQQKVQDLETIARNKDFQQKSLEINMRGVGAELHSEEVKILDKELQNELDTYILKKKKEELDYRAKKEKDIVRQDVKAQVFEKKYEIARKRYGYLYKSTWEDRIDEDGNITKVEVPSKDFTPNKLINKLKEIAHYYNNLSATAQKMIWTTLKLVLVIGGVALVGWGLVEAVKFISSNGITL